MMRKQKEMDWWTVQRKQVELLEQQVELLHETNQLLKKIVAAR